MRTCYLVAAVMLFATGGAAFGQSIDGVAEINATGGGAEVSARAAARLERREMRRDRRESQLNALRAASRLQADAHTEAALQSSDLSAAELLFMIQQEDAAEQDAADPSATTDDSGDDPVYGDDVPPYIYTTAAGEAEARGNGRGAGNGNARGRLFNLFAPLERLRGGADAESDTDASAAANARGRAVGLVTPVGNVDISGDADLETHAAAVVNADGRPHFNHDRAGRILAHRLAQIDALRDRALAEGNEHLLDVADQLEATARLQYTARVGTASTIGDPPVAEDPSEGGDSTVAPPSGDDPSEPTGDDPGTPTVEEPEPVDPTASIDANAEAAGSVTLGNGSGDTAP